MPGTTSTTAGRPAGWLPRTPASIGPRGDATWRGRSGALFAASVAVLLALMSVLVGFSDSERIEFTVWMLSFWILAFAAVATRPSRDLFDPYSSLIFLFGLYAWSGAAFAASATPPMYAIEVMRIYYFCVTLGLISFWIGHRLVAQKHLKEGARRIDPPAATFDQRFGVMLFATAVMSILLRPGFFASLDARNIQAYTEVIANWTLDFRSDPRAGVDLFVATLPAFYMTAALLYVACRTGSVWRRLLAAIPVTYLVALDVMRGEKMLLLASALFIVLFIHYRRRPIRAPALIVPTLVLYIFAVMIGHARGTSNLGEMLSRSVDLLRSDPSLLLPINAGELTGPPQTLFVVAESIQQGSSSFLGFDHYQDEIRVWIPRALMPNRPRPVSEQYIETFFPDEDRAGVGHGMFVLTPGYWAFGYVGLGLEMLLYGTIVAWVYNLFRSRPASDASVLIYSQCLFVLTFMCIRTGLLGTLRATIMAVVPLVPVLVTAYVLSRLSERGRQFRPSRA